MKIERELIKNPTIEEFAEANDLTMVITERVGDIHPDARFVARFRGAETKDGVMLLGVAGNGKTELIAINEYARRISNQLLVINAMSPTRREIPVPTLMLNYDDNRDYDG